MKTKLATTVFVLIISCTTSFAQDKSKTDLKQSASTKMEMTKDSVYYTCPMHSEVKMDKPGKCPKCGMALEKKTMKMTQTKSKNMEALKTYTCSMHPEVKSDKPGKCPKCGMTLVEKTDMKKGGMHNMHNMHNMQNMHDSTMMKKDSTKMKKCC